MRLPKLASACGVAILATTPLSCTLDSEGTGATSTRDASADAAAGSGGSTSTLDGGGGTGGNVTSDGAADSGLDGGGGMEDASVEAADDVVEPDVVAADVVEEPDVVEPDVVEADVVEADVVEADVVEADVAEDVTSDAVEEPAPTCDDLFGTAPQYSYCEESATTCKFSALTNGGTCTTMCQSLGATCANAWDNGNDPCVVISSGDTCDTPRTTEICECRRP